jgi:cytochrome c5
MSDPQNEHESLIKTPRQLIAAIAAAFLVPIIVIVLLVQYVASDSTLGAGSDAMTEEAVAARLRPVADIGFTLVDPSAPRELRTGEVVYKLACMACHDTGAAGAPRLGDPAAWTARLAQGQETVVTHAITGIRGMPPKGGMPDLDNIEVERAVVYLVNQSGGKFAEPEAPPAAEPAQEAGTSGVPAPQPQPAPAQPAQPQAAKIDGKKIYDTACALCHTPGVAGAPKTGDKAAWAPRIEQGQDILYTHAIKGFQGKAGFMPPRGGSAASEDQVKAAVDYMVNASK